VADVVSRSTVLGLALVVFCVAGGARAQDVAPSEADRRLAQGEALFEAENYDAALAEFEAAHGLLEGNPDRYLLLWNIGQCHERLFRYDRALDYYQRYLDEGGPDAADRAAVEATMRALESLLATVSITVNVEGAVVWVDGHEVGDAPGDVRVTSGTHSIEIRASGYATEIREVQVAVRGEAHIEVTLRVISDYEGLDPWIFWTSAGLAVATGIAGAGVGISALVESSNVQAFPVDARSQEDRDRVGALALGADVLYGVAGLFATTAVVLAFLTDWDGSPGSAPTGERAVLVVPWLDGERVGLSIGGAW
jgi:hypothetical protein